MPTIKNIIDVVDAIKVNTYTDANKIAWMNSVDEEVKKKVLQNFIKLDIQRVKDTYIYDLPSGVVFSDIESVFIDRVEVPKLDQRIYVDGVYGQTGYYKTSAGKLGIQPTPTVTDEVATPLLRMVYLEPYTPLTLTSESLLITDQFKDLYEFFMIAKIEFFNKEYEAYNNTIIQYNARWKDYVITYSRKQPTNKSMKITNLGI